MGSPAGNIGRRSSESTTLSFHVYANVPGPAGGKPDADLVMDKILSNMKDVVYDPAVSHRRRRFKYPRRSEAFFLNANAGTIDNSAIPQDVRNFVQETIVSEFTK